MTNKLTSAMSWLADKMNSFASTAAVYCRESLRISMNVSLGRTEYEVEDESGIIVGAHMTDFLVLQDDLSGLTPAQGDYIEYGGRKYEVSNLAGEGCWRWSTVPPNEADTAENVLMRIHTRDIGDA